MAKRGRPPQTHCQQGHDYAAVGRASNGGCALCRRDYNRRWAAKRARSLVAFPAIPAPPRLFTLATARRVRRRVLSEGVAIPDIADALGCSRRTVYEMVHGKRATYQEFVIQEPGGNRRGYGCGEST